MWTVPLAWHYRRRVARWNRQLLFLALWFVPPFVFHLLVHIGDSGHALATIPALCLAGGVCTIEAQTALATKQAANAHPIGPVIWLALLGNVALFFWPYSLPQRKEVPHFRGWASIQDAALVGAYETSYAHVRYIGRTTRQALRRIAALKSGTRRPVVLLWNRDAVPVWRKVAYYRPSERVYELTGRRTARPRARLWRGKRMLSDVSGPPSVKLTVPKQGRLIWLVHPDVVTDLSRAVRLRGAFPAYYTDLEADTPEFQWGSFEFVPE